MSGAVEQVQELLDAARAYTAAKDRYHTACMRLALKRGVKNVEVKDWPEELRAVCDVLNEAGGALDEVLVRLFPETSAERAEAWKAYHARFYGRLTVRP